MTKQKQTGAGERVKQEKLVTNIRKYGLTELWSIVPDDRWAVRDEALRRHGIAVKKLAKAQKEVADLESILKEAM